MGFSLQRQHVEQADIYLNIQKVVSRDFAALDAAVEVLTHSSLKSSSALTASDHPSFDFRIQVPCPAAAFRAVVPASMASFLLEPLRLLSRLGRRISTTV